MQYLFTFTEGIFAFISPCILPMLPIFLAYLSADEKQTVAKRLINTFFFVLGFTTAFTLMGATAFSLGSFMARYKEFLVKLAGVILVFFGFVYLDFIQISLGGSGLKKGKSGLVGNFLFGISYSFGWTPCLGAFLGSALAMASVQETVVQGMLLLACFGLGLGVPFLISAVLIDKLKSAFNWIKAHYRTVNLVCGGLLVLVGVMMATGMLGKFLAVLS